MNTAYVPYVFMLIGSIMMLTLFFLLIRRWRFQKKGEKVEGRVVDMIYRHYYYPVVEFVTKKGEQMRVEYHIGTNPPIARVGSTIKIYYHPQQPEKILLPLDIVTGSLYFIIFLISLACIVLGGILFVLSL